MEIKELVKLLKKKDTAALDYFVLEYSNLIFKIANGVLNDREVSKEIVNDVVLKIWNNVSKFDDQYEKFPAWVMLVTRYTAIDRLRKEVKHNSHENIDNMSFADSTNIDSEFENTQRLKEVKKEINNMNDIDKEIFMRKFYDDTKVSEIGKKMGLTEKFINLRIFRGRKKLREKLGVERG